MPESSFSHKSPASLYEVGRLSSTITAVDERWVRRIQASPAAAQNS
ncbi:hypothetical protein [Nonomuraea sp. LPB2021202275-12-8]